MALKRFKNFINEGKVFFEPGFYEVLKKLKDSNKIANHLFDIQGKEFEKMKIGLVGFSDNNKRLKFKSFDKLKKEIENYRGGDRGGYVPGGIDLDKAPTLKTFKAFEDIIKVTKDEVKIGKALRKILKSANINDFKDSDIEEFVNIIKSESKVMNDEFRNFELVNGYNINKYYLEENYSKGPKGDLGNSCMRQPNRNHFMDFYALNPESVSLLIHKDPNGKGILSRALIWNAQNVDTGENTKFMDRVYFSEPSEVELFHKYADEKGWDYDSSTDYVIEIIPGRYKNYPFLDTFFYYNFEDGVLTNNPDLYSDEKTIILTRINGNYDCHECNGEYERDCEECYGNGFIECEECEGYGEVSCEECNVIGEDCEKCDGDGFIECEECEGHSNKDCHNCYGGKVEGCIEISCENHHESPIVQ